MRKELLRQSLHLVYGITLTLLTAWNSWIGVAMSIVIAIGILVYRKRELTFIAWFMKHLEREERIQGFGALTLTVGITSVILVFPESGIIAGIGVALIDSIATLIGIFDEDNRKHLLPSIVGGFVFFIVSTSIFSDVSVWHLGVAAVVGALTEFVSTRSMIVDDNITIPWAIVLTLVLL